VRRTGSKGGSACCHLRWVSIRTLAPTDHALRLDRRLTHNTHLCDFLVRIELLSRLENNAHLCSWSKPVNKQEQSRVCQED
jgi:hypothetical protein